MASIDQQYWGLSHRLRGIFTTLEGIIDLLQREEQISMEYHGMIGRQHTKAYNEIEEFRILLETRAKEREKMYQEFLKMLTQLHDQLDELKDFIKGAFTTQQKVEVVDMIQKDMLIELLVAEINMMATMVRRMFDFNRNIERKTPWE